MKTLLTTVIFFTSVVSPVFGEEDKYKFGSCKLPLYEMGSEQFENLENLDKSELVACLRDAISDNNLLNVVASQRAQKLQETQELHQSNLLSFSNIMFKKDGNIRELEQKITTLQEFISKTQSNSACLTAVEKGKRVLDGRTDNGDTQLVFVHNGQSVVFQLGSENLCRFMPLE